MLLPCLLRAGDLHSGRLVLHCAYRGVVREKGLGGCPVKQVKIAVIGSYPEASWHSILGVFPEDWAVRFAPRPEAVSILSDADVLLPEHLRVDAALLSRAPNLRLVQTGAGYDHVDLAACAARGVWVCNAPGVNAQAVAEHVMAFLLAWYKNIPYLDRFMKDGGGEESLCYAGGELYGKTVGVIGLGAIGGAVSRLCAAFGMEVLGYSRTPKPLPGLEQVGLEELYRRSDVVTVHVPLTAETRHMVGAEAFSLMKPDALLTNASRGAVVDETELVQALQAHVIGGACLDVFEEEPLSPDNPLRALPNVLLSPPHRRVPGRREVPPGPVRVLSAQYPTRHGGTSPGAHAERAEGRPLSQNLRLSRRLEKAL